MKLSINKNIINKNEALASHSKGFEPFDINAEEFSTYIASGFAFSYQFLGCYRNADNFICSDIIAADFDEGMTLGEAMADDFIANKARLLYTTPSHTQEKHRFRVVFQLPRTITDGQEVRSAQRGLTRRFPADKASIDAGRQFYGSRGSVPHIFGNVLSPENLDLLIKLGEEPIKFSDRSDKVSGGSVVRSRLTISQDMEVRDKRGELVKLSNLKKSVPIFCPFHNDKKPSAFTTESQAGIRGIHCSSCLLTFWPQAHKPAAYDFYAFEKLVKQPHARPMDFTGRPMKGFVFVAHAGIEADEDLQRWVGHGVDNAMSLPVKAVSPPRVSKKKRVKPKR